MKGVGERCSDTKVEELRRRESLTSLGAISGYGEFAISYSAQQPLKNVLAVAFKYDLDAAALDGRDD